jgi:hypothetical protein
MSTQKETQTQNQGQGQQKLQELAEAFKADIRSNSGQDLDARVDQFISDVQAAASSDSEQKQKK